MYRISRSPGSPFKGPWLRRSAQWPLPGASARPHLMTGVRYLIKYSWVQRFLSFHVEIMKVVHLLFRACLATSLEEPWRKNYYRIVYKHEILHEMSPFKTYLQVITPGRDWTQAQEQALDALWPGNPPWKAPVGIEETGSLLNLERERGWRLW